MRKWLAQSLLSSFIYLRLSQIILEFIVIVIFSAIVVFEYNRTLQKEEKKDNKRKQDFNDIRSTIEQLEKTLELQSTQLETLSKLLSGIKVMRWQGNKKPNIDYYKKISIFYILYNINFDYMLI